MSPSTLALAVAALIAAIPAQNCAATSTGRTPLSDLGTGSYQGFTGGLYGSGLNTLPPAHLQAGLARAAAVQALDQNGVPSSSGRIVLLSIGMSNTTQEFSQFVTISNGDPNRRGSVVVVDGAQGGQDAVIVANPNAQFWTVVQQRLTNAGVTPQQVQVVWLKEAIAGVTGGFPGGSQTLRDRLGDIARNLQAKYHNVKLCFLSSRIYAGYATTTLNPEPYAYESGFSVQWVIGQQMGGTGNLNFDPAQGAVVAPWLGWGPYLWADGLTPRSDGLTWLCTDLQPDGTHPSSTGQVKVANMLQAFFTTNQLASSWYLGPNSAAVFALYGSGCPGVAGVPRMRNNGLPVLGNATFRVGVSDTRANAPAMLFLSGGAGNLPVAPGCSALIDPTLAFPSFGAVTSATATAILNVPVPNQTSLLGFEMYGQWFVEDGAGSPLPPLLGIAATQGARMRVGL